MTSRVVKKVFLQMWGDSFPINNERGSKRTPQNMAFKRPKNNFPICGLPTTKRRCNNMRTQMRNHEGPRLFLFHQNWL